MIGRFKKDGWLSSQLAAFSYDANASNATTAAIISAKVDSIQFATGSPTVAIVGHSMGTLSARYYIKNLGGEARRVGARLVGRSESRNERRGVLLHDVVS